MYQTRSLLLRPELLHEQIGPLFRKTMNMFKLTAFAMPFDDKSCLTVIALWDLGMQAPRSPKPSDVPKGIPWASVTKTRYQMHIKSPLWEILTLWSTAEREKAHRWLLIRREKI